MPASITLYTYANCSTCRSAVGWLRSKQINFAEKPIYTEPPTLPELCRMLAHQGGNLRRLFNTSGLQYRAQGLSVRLPKISTDDALALLASDGRLIKRPFLLGETFGLVGFDPEEWAEELGT